MLSPDPDVRLERGIGFEQAFLGFEACIGRDKDGPVSQSQFQNQGPVIRESFFRIQERSENLALHVVG